MATCKYTKKDISGIPSDKPVVYEIQTNGGKCNYVGTAHRGRVRERILEHKGEIPGARVAVRQFDSIEDARREEARRIASNKPKYNKQGRYES